MMTHFVIISLKRAIIDYYNDHKECFTQNNHLLKHKH